jgi:hypothetical protein
MVGGRNLLVFRRKKTAISGDSVRFCAGARAGRSVVIGWLPMARARQCELSAEPGDRGNSANFHGKYQ